ncbi:hypothetical protein [Algoriphagus marinus]|uniref:hypothetical protein n=1 Tax=Algoriphagus marinus TaxID=1925762 RepID=UPI000A899B86|nr:hypothetical protein [Algoriphagus marinus]
MKTIYFLPIKSMNLAHYLSSGIIAPANYIENRNQDLQNKFNNNLLLSSSKFTTESNCSIEIAFDEKEEMPKKISDNFFLFDMPIPISRIKGIYFAEKEQKTNTVFNITSGAAFIPDTILILSEDKPIATDELQNLVTKPTQVDWKHFLKKFDQIMGGFALMKIGKEDFQNYPTHYFKTLGNINKHFHQILNDQGVEIENAFEFAFTDNGKFKNFHDTIYSDITSEIVAKYAHKDNVKIETKNGLIQIDKIPETTQTYLVSILDTYGPRKRKQADSFISDLVSGNFNEKRKEGLSLIFGINKGYSSFRNKYKTENFEALVKFKLDSKIDYYTIESIYQFVFNNKSQSSFYSYIDNWCHNAEDQVINKSKFVTYQVLDKTIILKKKEDFFIELFRTSLEKRDRLFEIISKNLSKSLPKFLPLDTNLFKEQLHSEYEEFFREYSQYIFSETSKKIASEYESETKINQNKISELSSKLEDKQNIIEQLQKKLDDFNLQTIKKQETEKIDIESKSSEQSADNNIKAAKENISKTENEEDTVKTIENKDLNDSTTIESSSESVVSEPKEPNNQSYSGSLFSDENIEIGRKRREKELKALKVSDLKSIISDYKLKPASSLKEDLINDILRKEF